MPNEQDPQQQHLLDLFDYEMPIDDESAELTLARLDWYMQQDCLSLIVFLGRLGVDKSIILATLQFMRDCNKDHIDSLEVTLGDRLPDQREPMRHPELDAIEQAISDYSLADVEFTATDFAALQGIDVQAGDLDELPEFVVELMNSKANQLMSGDDFSREILDARALTTDEAILEIESKTSTQ